MKKIFSLLLVVSMLCAMMITANAAYTMGFTADKTTVKVGETFDVVLNIGLTDGQQTSGGSIVLNYDSNYATLEAITEGTMTAGATNWVDLGTAKANKTFTTALTESGTFCVATFRAVAPIDEFVVSAKTVSFTFRNPTKREADASTVTPVTVKIETDAPVVEYEDKTFYGEAATADTADITIGEDVYTNVAVFNPSVEIADLGEGETFVEAGVKIGEKTRKFDINGDAEFSILFYGITPEQANGLNVVAYYIANVVKAN